jgi:HK97 family phage portal protein
VKRALIPPDGAVAPDPPADPRGDVIPNTNPPLGTVGVDLTGPGGESGAVMPGYLSMVPFDGWPAGWDVPWMEPTPAFSTFFGFGAADPAGYLERVSTVGTCVDINSRAVVAMAAYAVTAGVPVDLPDWYQTSPEPLEYSDWCEFVGRLVDDLQLHGEAILWATDRYADGYVRRFVALDPPRVTIDERGRYGVTLDTGDVLDVGRADGTPNADVCHIRYKHDRATHRGFGPLAWAGRDIVSADLLNRYADNIARHGASAVLSAPGDLSSKQADDIRRDWARLRSQNPGTPAVLAGGITYTPQSMSPRDMALLDLKVFDLQMISTAMGVPAGMAGLPQAAGGLTYSSPVMLRETHWTGFLLALCQRIAGPLSNWLLPRGTRFEFNPDRYLQASAGERALTHATLFGIVDEHGRRATTVPEIRTVERMAPWDALGEPSAGGPTPTDALVGSARG